MTIFSSKYTVSYTDTETGEDVSFDINADFSVICPNRVIGIKDFIRGGKPAMYRGEFRFVSCQNNSDKFYLVNCLDVEYYLKGVVPCEMPVSFGLEALKSQAVAARVYSLTPRARMSRAYDVVDSVASQVYYGYNRESDIANKAIDDAATAAKTVTIGGWDESVKDNVSGATIHIYFTNGNTAVASGSTYVTLNIDGCGAHQIITYADANVGAFSPGVYEFTFVPSNVPGDNSYRWLMGANALSAITADSAITAGTATSVPWSGVTGKPSLDFIPTSQKGANSGVATLDANGKVPSSQLPSYVDDVLEYAARSLFPSTGTSGIIYVDTSTNLTYRWSGSDYVEISPSLALGETSSTAYRGDRGATAYAHATDSGRLTTAVSTGLYKVSVTGEGHVGSATAVTKSDITALGIPGDSGVTSITIKGTSPITIDSESAITTTGTRTISLANSYGDTKNPYAAKVANTVLAGPASGNDAAPTFR